MRKQKREYKKRGGVGFQDNFDKNGHLISKRGKWTEEETVAYFRFLLVERVHFEMPGERKKNQIFMKMSETLTTRTPDQCRSHHQKIQNYAETKQVIGICHFILEKLRPYPIFKQLEAELQKSMGETISTKTQSHFEIREQNYKMIGNERGYYNLILDIDGFTSW